jgi:hypothetical protein
MTMPPLKDSTFQEIYGQDSGETQKIKNDSDSDDGDNRIFLLRAKQYRFCLCRNSGFGKS